MNELQNIQLNVPKLHERIPSKALEVVSTRLPEITSKVDAFNRSNSQTTLSMMTLTMMTGQSPYRQILQIMAEIDRRQAALAEAQVSYAELLEKAPDPSDSEAVHSAKQRLKLHSLASLEGKIAASIKDIATLIEAYDNLVSKHGLSDWSEEDFERNEFKHHVRRGFELLYRDVIEAGRPRAAAIEYLQQFGIHIQVANLEVIGYTMVVEQLVRDGKPPSATHLENFLDEMAEKYVDHAKEAAERMFGTSSIGNPEFMTQFSK